MLTSSLPARPLLSTPHVVLYAQIMVARTPLLSATSLYPHVAFCTLKSSFSARPLLCAGSFKLIPFRTPALWLFNSLLSPAYCSSRNTLAHLPTLSPFLLGARPERDVGVCPLSHYSRPRTVEVVPWVHRQSTRTGRILHRPAWSILFYFVFSASCSWPADVTLVLAPCFMLLPHPSDILALSSSPRPCGEWPRPNLPDNLHSFTVHLCPLP